MKADFSQLSDVLVDPSDGSGLTVSSDGASLVSTTGQQYEVISGVPNLLPPGGLTLGAWAFPEVVVGDLDRPKPVGRLRRTTRRLKHGWFAPASHRANAHALLRRELLESNAGRPARILVVGGASLGSGAEWMVDDPTVEYAAFDVYPTAETAFLGDAHRIPVADESMDVVWVQAVLEHVYRPDIVVREIHRVLKSNGLVYAETPFLQPVHEGAFDFTRYTVSGHTLLFDGFDAMVAGPIGGPGAMLNLALRGVAEGVTRSRWIGRAVYVASLPLRLLDRFVRDSTRRDYCIGAFLLARRSDGPPEAIDPVALYRSALE